MRFPAVLRLIASVVLVAAEAIQVCAITMPYPVHIGISVLISTLITAGVLATQEQKLVAEVPHQLLVAITALIGFAQAYQTDIQMGSLAHKLIAIGLCALGALFTSDTVAPVVSLHRGARAVPPAA